MMMDKDSPTVNSSASPPEKKTRVVIDLSPSPKKGISDDPLKDIFREISKKRRNPVQGSLDLVYKSGMYYILLCYVLILLKYCII